MKETVGSPQKILGEVLVFPRPLLVMRDTSMWPLIDRSSHVIEVAHKPHHEAMKVAGGQLFGISVRGLVPLW